MVIITVWGRLRWGVHLWAEDDAVTPAVLPVGQRLEGPTVQPGGSNPTAIHPGGSGPTSQLGGSAATSVR